MLDFFRKVSTFVISPVNLLQNWLNGPPQIQTNLINFDLEMLCPAELDNRKIKKWLNTYLEKFEDDTLLLWVDKKAHLKASYRQNAQVHHVSLANFTVDPITKKIMHDDQEISTLKPVLQQLTLAYSINIPDAATLLDFKDQVYLDNKKITKAMIANINKKTEREISNIESTLECLICKEEYDNQHLPHMAESGHYFHKGCYQAYAATKAVPTDPVTNEIISYPLQLTPALAHYSLIKDAVHYRKHLETMSQMLEILQSKNTKLKAKLKRAST